MSIRYRLLLVVGLVTSVVFVFSFFFQNKSILEGITQSKDLILEFQLQSYEKRRTKIEDFITHSMAKKLAQVNVLLETISKFPALSEWFSPSAENLKEGTWNHAATLLQNDDWIQFLQNTSGDQLLSLIVPDQGPFFQMESVPFDEGLAWVFIEGSSKYSKPCLGIKLPIKAVQEEFDAVSSLLDSGVIPSVYVLYTLEKFRSLYFSSDFFQSDEMITRVPFIQGYELDEEKFLSFLMKASDLVKDPQFKEPESKEENRIAEEKPLIYSREHPSFEELIQSYLSGVMEYSSELFLVWEATALQQLNLFGPRKPKSYWPDAMSFSLENPNQGKVFFLKTALDFSTPIFNDQIFFQKNPPKKGSFVSSSGGVVKSPYPNQAFFVNTAAIHSGKEEDKKQSLLTLGFDLSDFLDDLVTTSGHYGCVVSGEEVVVHMAPEGAKSIPYDAITALLTHQTSSVSGTVTLADVEYYFMKIRPNASLDLHFFFFLPKDEEFGLFKEAQRKIHEIKKRIWTERLGLQIFSLLVLWFLLLNLSKKITRPIVALSASLKHVKNGEWDLIKLPKIKESKQDEIYQLMDSFQDMVEGMKEKEKMSGLLNKVVSKEIAHEILKGDVHLGGEEKVVTMLFADIRGFTRLTQNMEPHSVIDLLNTCMTKLSKAIEENKGVIDKYLGDGIMALYGAPVSYKESSLYAVISGMEMIKVIQEWDLERIEKGLPPLDIGIGIHTGSVCAGNMGAQHRLNYTVIGSHVNMASRLCYAAEPGEILISVDTYLEPCVKQNVEVEDKGFMTFKGFDEKKQVYKVIGLKDKNMGNILILQGNESDEN